MWTSDKESYLSLETGWETVSPNSHKIYRYLAKSESVLLQLLKYMQILSAPVSS